MNSTHTADTLAVRRTIATSLDALEQIRADGHTWTRGDSLAYWTLRNLLEHWAPDIGGS